MTNELLQKAINYETLASFFKDRDKAYSLLDNIGDAPFPSKAKSFVDSYLDEEKLCEEWRRVRDSFSSSKIPFEIISTPELKENSVHFLYGAGNVELRDGKSIVILGAKEPSLQAKKDTTSVIDEAIKENLTILCPLELGLSSFALSYALKNNGKVIALLSSWLTKCPSEVLQPLMEEVYNKGLLLTQFAPSIKSEKWHVVLRNKLLAILGDAFFLPEEKDGGPSWPTFDLALTLNKPALISASILDNPNYKWCQDREKKGATRYNNKKDIKKLFGEKPKVRRTKKKETDDTLPLFS